MKIKLAFARDLTIFAKVGVGIYSNIPNSSDAIRLRSTFGVKKEK